MNIYIKSRMYVSPQVILQTLISCQMRRELLLLSYPYGIPSVQNLKIIHCIVLLTIINN